MAWKISYISYLYFILINFKMHVLILIRQSIISKLGPYSLLLKAMLHTKQYSTIIVLTQTSQIITEH